MPPSIKKALAIDPEPGSTYLDAEHVVFLMQENRSFDHCFGSLSGVRGFNDPRAITLPDKNLVWLQTNKAGETYTPFRFDIRDSKITWMGSIPHARHTQVDADRQGRYDNWLDAKKSGNEKYASMPITMGHYNREDLGFNYSMADAFTICDQNFSSGMTSTWPNRLFFWSGTIRGEKTGDAKAYVRNDIPYGEAHWKTYPERLEEHGVSWKVYQNDLSAGGGLTGDQRSWLSNFGCNPLEFLSQFNVRFYPRYVASVERRLRLLPDAIAALEKKMQGMSATDRKYEKLSKEIEIKKKVLADTNAQLKQWSRENFEKLTPYQRNLYEKAFSTNAGDPDHLELTTLSYTEDGQQRKLPIPKGDILYEFRKDVESGKLPTVSWLVPSQNFSDHPSAPWYGALLTSEILDILTKNPEVWKKTIFVLTYDENDGYFDHIPPFVAPDPKDPRTGKCSPGVNVTGAEYIYKEQEIAEGVSKHGARTGPIGLGFRVPMIVASPWSRGGKVCSQVFDHTSSLKFLEHFLAKKLSKQIIQENITEWRRTVTGDLQSVFSSPEEKPGAKVDFIQKDPFIEKIYNAKFKKIPSFQKLSPAQIAEVNRDPLTSEVMSHQEPGVRPARPLPYELYAEGKLTDDKKAFSLTLKAGNQVFSRRAAGSPFNLYAPGAYVSRETEGTDRPVMEPVRVWHYAVKAGDSLSDDFPLSHFQDGRYHLRAYGPNGFFREFRGDVRDPGLEVACVYESPRMLKTMLSGNVKLQVANPDTAKEATVTVTDHAYGNAPITRKIAAASRTDIVLDLGKSSGWYDFSVTVAGAGRYERRYAGHVETGKESITDPYMGRTV
jgi:phospholipase C